MCENREHRFRLTIKNLETGKSTDLVTYASGISQAVARADAWAHANMPSRDRNRYGHGPDASVSIEITVHRVGYNDRASAEEHGADFIFVDQAAQARAEYDAAQVEEDLLAKYG